jgi:hypothetical protein
MTNSSGTEFISSWGKSADEIRNIISEQKYLDGVCLRITVRDFKRLCDENGHVVKLDLPGKICGVLRTYMGCMYAEVLHTPNLSDAVVIADFTSKAMSEAASAELTGSTFQFEHLKLPCPPLAITSGSLADVLLD